MELIDSYISYIDYCLSESILGYFEIKKKYKNKLTVLKLQNALLNIRKNKPLTLEEKNLVFEYYPEIYKEYLLIQITKIYYIMKIQYWWKKLIYKPNSNFLFNKINQWD